MRRLLGIIIALSAATAACGGKGTSPTEPSSTPGTTTAAAATIGGTVQGPSAGASSGFSGGVALSGVTVSVVGTAITSTADGSGRFMLMNVPAGNVQLQFTGAGANATVGLDAVQPSQNIDLVVTVSGTSAAIDSQVRTGGSSAELEGRVESLPPTMPMLTFKAAGRTVKTDASTQFVDGSVRRSFSALAIGMRVHVKGSVSGDTFNATLVEIQNTQTDIPVEVNGTIDSLSGTAAAFQFNIGSRLVQGDASTAFFGDGDKPDTFADLKNGGRVEVKGQQRDGFVYAVRIHINDETSPGPPEDTSASIEGTLKAIGGTTPSLVLTVNTTTVRTSSSTTVKRRGDFQTLAELRVGQTLHVVGTRRADSSIDARLIEINDDADGGEFEIEGSLGGLKGTCPSISFGVNGFSIATNASTTFEGGACTALKSGDTVQVKGTKQADGSVLATRVKRE